jgi:Icc protein
MSHRIVQLTDCHLFADPAQALRGIVTRPRFEAAIRDVRARAPDAELLVFTGDTAHDESPATYSAVRTEIADWLDRVRIVPGNHDDRALLREVFPQAAGILEGRNAFHIACDDWQVIGLDSQIPGETAGLLGPDQLEWLNARLAAILLPVLIFVHHPPIAVHSPWLDRIGLQDAADLQRIVELHPHVRLIVTGHVHQELAGSLAHATVLTTPAVGPPFRPRTAELVIDDLPPSYRIIELNPDGSWSTQVLLCSME